ncbi:hypothetical protein Pmar_PMAR010745, partial [Perkinsus marinus ATCC 50983]
MDNRSERNDNDHIEFLLMDQMDAMWGGVDTSGSVLRDDLPEEVRRYKLTREE